MSTFKLHPLHTAKDHVGWMSDLGVHGYHEWLAAGRRTGRSTAQALEYIAEAMRKPGVRIRIRDHSNLTSSNRTRSNRHIDVMLGDLIHKYVESLGLDHLHLGSGADGPYVVFENRPPAPVMPAPHAVAPVPASDSSTACRCRLALGRLHPTAHRIGCPLRNQ